MNQLSAITYQAIIQALSKQPKRLKEIAQSLKLNAQLTELKQSLDDLFANKHVSRATIKNKQHVYSVSPKSKFVIGTVIGHRDGYGFLVSDDEEEDLFINDWDMKCILHGDQILVRMINRKYRQAKLVEVLQRANHLIVGRYQKQGKSAFVVPDNHHIHQNISVKNKKSIQSGCYVQVKITHQPDHNNRPKGEIVHTIDQVSPLQFAVDIACLSHQLPTEWNDLIKQEVAAIQPIINPDDRQDLRQLPFVTIDGDDAKDFDDAVYCQPKGKGWQLLVAIADVSHYVTAGTAIGDEAQQRGTSVYFPSKVIPMLPERLSNDLCSLKPKVDRLALVCDMSLDDKGDIVAYQFYKAAICSAARLTYEQVDKLWKQDKHDLPKPLIVHLQNLYSVYKLRVQQRQRLGLIDFSLTEAFFQYNDQGEVTDIKSQTRLVAHRVIEEIMLVANVSAGLFLAQHKMKVLYRVHDKPVAKKLDNMKSYIAKRGLGNVDPTTKGYAKLLETISKHDDRVTLEILLLRSMSLAVYQPKNIGHFGLGFEVYVHFTSPIRRYPDLLIHRAISHILDNKLPYHFNDLEQMGNHCSLTERRAENASRNVTQRLKCYFMQDKVGLEYRARVSSVNSFGLFVELSELPVEGLIHISNLPKDDYNFDASAYTLSGQRTGNIFLLGQKLTVRIAAVNMEKCQIDIHLLAASKS